jgi:hypothetical protein
MSHKQRLITNLLLILAEMNKQRVISQICYNLAQRLGLFHGHQISRPRLQLHQAVLVLLLLLPLPPLPLLLVLLLLLPLPLLLLPLPLLLLFNALLGLQLPSARTLQTFCELPRKLTRKRNHHPKSFPTTSEM